MHQRYHSFWSPWSLHNSLMVHQIIPLMFIFWTKKKIRAKTPFIWNWHQIRGQSKKSESWAVHLLICWLFLLFYSNNMHKWWMKLWFLTCQMPVLWGRTNFDPFLKTWKIFTPKFPMKYSKNSQNFTTSKNT